MVPVFESPFIVIYGNSINGVIGWLVQIKRTKGEKRPLNRVWRIFNEVFVHSNVQFIPTRVGDFGFQVDFPLALKIITPARARVLGNLLTQKLAKSYLDYMIEEDEPIRLSKVRNTYQIEKVFSESDTDVCLMTIKGDCVLSFYDYDSRMQFFHIPFLTSEEKIDGYPTLRIRATCNEVLKEVRSYLKIECEDDPIC